MELALGQVWADFRRVNPGAYVNAVRSYLAGFLRVARPYCYPGKLDIVLTKACNLRCTFCISYGSLKGERWMDFALYEEIARQLFPRAYMVRFCSGGEPLLYPRVREALQLAQRYRTLAQMISNGTLLNRETAQWLVDDQSLQELLISFDGARKETVERIRRGANYENILDNIDYLAALKTKRGLSYPRLSFHYIIMRSNLEELPEIFKICSRYGLYKVKVAYLNVTNELEVNESLFYHQEEAARVFEEARRRARESGIRLDLPPLPSQDHGSHRCLRPWQFCQIDTDGSIRFCYRAWLQRLGFFADGFRSIWRGEPYRKIRRTLNSPTPYFPYCRHCAVRLGFGQESSHNQKLHDEDYVIEGLEHLQIPFNQRRLENYYSFAELKAGPGSVEPEAARRED
jgi:MoaA/NifB/PqqE/SkfB family radical SAM enzyme